MMKNQKGITLIALVITIIVLLILAGVSIAMLTGENGILTQANNSKAETAKAEATEKINMTLNAIKAEIYSQQVTTSTWSPVGDGDGETVTDGIKDAITALIKADLGADVTHTGTPAEGKYDYNFNSSNNQLTISYINSASGVKTAVSGYIVLTPASHYEIHKAQ